jgi:hypothetical protein
MEDAAPAVLDHKESVQRETSLRTGVPRRWSGGIDEASGFDMCEVLARMREAGPRY